VNSEICEQLHACSASNTLALISASLIWCFLFSWFFTSGIVKRLNLSEVNCLLPLMACCDSLKLCHCHSFPSWDSAQCSHPNLYPTGRMSFASHCGHVAFSSTRLIDGLFYELCIIRCFVMAESESKLSWLSVINRLV
jgi:hypothetical protein